MDTSRFSGATLSGIITQASKRVDDFIEYTLDLETITNEKTEGHIDSDNNLVIFARKKPIVSVQSVSISKGSYSAIISLTDGAGSNVYDIPKPNGKIVFPGATISMQSVSIIDFKGWKTTQFYTLLSYTAGYASIPVDIQDATSLYVLDILARRTNLTGASSISQGGISITYSSRKGKSDFVQDAESILNSYKRVTGF